MAKCPILTPRPPVSAFDDPVYDLFRFNDRKYESLYHFTVGGPVALRHGGLAERWLSGVRMDGN